MPVNQTYALQGIAAQGDYAQATGGAAVQKLIDLVSPDSTSTLRGFMDEMSPAAQVQLLAELTALKAGVLLFEAP